MHFVCNAAWSADTELEVIEGVDPGGEGIHVVLDDDPPFDSNDPGTSPPYVDDWRLMAGGTFVGECDHQARFMNTCLLMLGAPGGTVHKVHPSTDMNVLEEETRTASQLGITEDLDGDGEFGEEILTLMFAFRPEAPDPAWNHFEGALETTGGFYAVWPKQQAPSACELLLTLLRPRQEGGEGALQYWYLSRPDSWPYHYPEYPDSVPGPGSCP